MRREDGRLGWPLERFSFLRVHIFCHAGNLGQKARTCKLISRKLLVGRLVGGEGGIRTPGTITGTSDFESGAFNRALPPLRACGTDQHLRMQRVRSLAVYREVQRKTMRPKVALFVRSAHLASAVLFQRSGEEVLHR